jgi:phosphonate transport system substrate-binding protein
MEKILSRVILTLLSLTVIVVASEIVTITFGVYQSDKATVMYRKFTPILEILEEKVEAQLNVPVSFELRIFKDYDEANDAITNGEVDFVRFGPASYIIAKKRNNYIKLLVMEERKGKKRFKGVVVVKSESPYTSLKDLKGTDFAFGASKSTIGRYLIQAELVKAGLTGGDFKSYNYLDRHDKVFKAVEIGDYHAGSVKETTYKRYNKGDSLRILFSFENVTKPWIARAGLADETFTAIQETLLSLEEDTATLKELKVTGFLPTSDSEYEYVRKSMELVSQFSDDPF